MALPKIYREDVPYLIMIAFILALLVAVIAGNRMHWNQREKLLKNHGPLVEVTSPSVNAQIAKQLPTADRFLITHPVGNIVGICAHIPLLSIGDKADRGYSAITRPNGEIDSIERISDPRLCG